MYDPGELLLVDYPGGFGNLAGKWLVIANRLGVDPQLHHETKTRQEERRSQR